MVLPRRQKLIIIPLLLYWPTIFILTHIPIPQLSGIEIRASDKVLHYFAYLILVLLIWLAISPGKKVNWRRAAVWWILFAVVWYGVADEWLQGYVGRSPDVRDFLGDLAGTITGLILLSIFPFWPVSLVLTGSAIFVLTNFMRVNSADEWLLVNLGFHLFAYTLFSLLWLQYLDYLVPIKALQPRWLIGAFALPIGFLAAIEIFSVAAGNGFRLLEAITALTGITIIIMANFLVAKLQQKSKVF
jgi:hypothetical protein